MNNNDNDRFTEAFILSLKQLRKERKLSHEKLAKLSNLSRQVIGRLETLELSSPTLSTVRKITHALDIKLSDFIKKVEDNMK